VAIFSISAFLAGLAGGLYAGLLEGASSAFFNSFTSLLWITVAVVGGIQSAYGAIVGALLFYFVPQLFSGGDPSPWLTPVFGVAAVLLARRPGGVVGLVSERWPRKLIAVRPRAAGAQQVVEVSADG
jgi:ABC-type branched-subunit amino acid transport system permease subunit